MPDYGKRFDTFEMALNQLSEYLYGISIPNLDCISRRCFGYKMGDSVGEWFSPYVETKEAAEYLRDTLKMPFVYREIKTADDVASLLQSSGCVLGPIRTEFSVKEIHNFYYDGKKHYISVFREKDGCRVFDPWGLPGVLYSEVELIQRLSGVKSGGIYLNSGSGHVHIPNSREIFEMGMRFHQEIKETEAEELESAICSYENTAGNRISLNYSLQNFVMQMDKIFELLRQTEGLSEKKAMEYIGYKQELYEKGMNGDWISIPQVVKKIWEMYDNEY